MGKLTPTLILLALAPFTAHGADVGSILEKQQQLQVARWEGVQSYAVLQTVMDQQLITVFERAEVAGADGKRHPVFVRAQPGSTGDPTTQAFLENYGDAARQVGDGLSTEMENGLEKAGLPRGLFSGGGSGDPWTSTDPRTMMGGLADFTDAAAAGSAAQDEPSAQAASTVDGMAEFARRARLLGSGEIDGRKAFHLMADGLDRVQNSDGQEFRLDTVHLWIDAQDYVPLKTEMSGVASTATESRPITLTRLDTDYREVAGSKLYEARRQVLSMQGVTTPEQQEQMQEAQEQLGELDRQLASMPEAQRQMMMGRMGPQMEMIRSMASGGGMRMETIVHEIIVNPTLADLERLRSRAGGVAGAAGFAPAAGIASVPSAPQAGAAEPGDAQAAQQACLQQKMEAAQQAQQTKRGFGKLMSAAGRVAGRFGGPGISRAMGDIYAANATVADLEAAAKDLGLAEEEIEACRQPG